MQSPPCPSLPKPIDIAVNKYNRTVSYYHCEFGKHSRWAVLVTELGHMYKGMRELEGGDRGFPIMEARGRTIQVKPLREATRAR